MSAAAAVTLDADTAAAAGGGLGERFVSGPLVAIQRARLLAAASELVCEHGAGEVTIAQVVERAGVSRRTFYEIFEGWEACLLAVLDTAFASASACVLPSWRSRGVSWRERLRSSLLALLVLFDAQPAVARLLLVESVAAGWPLVSQRRQYALRALTSAIDQGRENGRGGAAPLSAEGALGGVLSILQARVEQSQQGLLVELAGPLMAMLVLPFLGAAAARRELQLPTPAPSSLLSVPADESPDRCDPFKTAGMRMTHRTVSVLAMIAEHPGSSNRRVGDLARMRDQGQVSKLLARVERAGLIANDGPGARSKGEPNAWSLTVVGRQVIEGLGMPVGRPGSRDGYRVQENVKQREATTTCHA